VQLGAIGLHVVEFPSASHYGRGFHCRRGRTTCLMSQEEGLRADKDLPSKCRPEAHAVGRRMVTLVSAGTCAGPITAVAIRSMTWAAGCQGSFGWLRFPPAVGDEWGADAPSWVKAL